MYLFACDVVVVVVVVVVAVKHEADGVQRTFYGRENSECGVVILSARTRIDGSLADGQMSRSVSRTRSVVDDVETNAIVHDRPRYFFAHAFSLSTLGKKALDEF